MSKLNLVFFGVVSLLLPACTTGPSGRNITSYQKVSDRVIKIIQYAENVDFPVGPGVAPHKIREYWLAMALIAFFDTHLNNNDKDKFINICNVNLKDSHFDKDFVCGIIRDVLYNNLHVDINGFNHIKYSYLNFSYFLDLRESKKNTADAFKRHGYISLYEIACAEI